jgi:8-oxo-dGTP pyrophosphatase MutT (NUDIX family)
VTPAPLLSAADLPARPDDLARAREALAAHRADDPGQGEVRERVLAFVDAHPDALHRSCGPGHLTGSALVVDPVSREVLVLFHTKLRRWLQPGGHADGDGELAAVALREATEETGIEGLRVDPDPLDLDIHRVAPPGDEPHDHLDVRFLVVAPAGAQPSGNHESQDLRWVEIGRLPALGADPGLIRLAAAGMERLAAGKVRLHDRR